MVDEVNLGQVSFTDREAILMGEMQPESFYWNLKKKIVEYLLTKYIPSDTVTLDIGCGTGYLIPDDFPLRSKYIGLDAVQSSLDQCKKNIPAADALIFGGLGAISHLANKVDTVILLDVLEHIEHDDEFLSSIAGILRINGQLIISVPAHQFLYSAADQQSGHYRRYSETMLAKKLKAAGFRPVFRSSFIVLCFPILVMSRVISKFRKSYDLKSEHSSFANTILSFLIPLEFLLTKNFKFLWGGSTIAVWKRVL